MKILGHRHTGIIVHDLDRMINFYVGLGFVLKRRDLERGPFIDGLLNTENIVLETAKLIIESENVPIHYLYCLELVTLNHDQDTVNCERLIKKGSFDFRKKSIGVLDIAFTVDNIEAVCQYIITQGGDIIGKPMKAVAGFPALHCYSRDPEGNVLHIAQNQSA